jgi:hypothetical protein
VEAVRKDVRVCAVSFTDDIWFGALQDVETELYMWLCEHDHSDDISAEFCALDYLIANPEEDFEDDDSVLLEFPSKYLDEVIGIIRSGINAEEHSEGVHDALMEWCEIMETYFREE